MTDVLTQLANRTLTRKSLPGEAVGISFFLFVLYYILVGTLPQANIAGESIDLSDNDTYGVVKVVDGDTIKVLLNGTEETVRLLGIDTPESIKPNTPVQCFSKEATRYLTTLLEGHEVFLEPDPTQANRDRYGRLLRYVFLTDETNINEQIINEGFGFEFTFESQPYLMQSKFIQAEESARLYNRGLWASCTCNGNV